MTKPSKSPQVSDRADFRALILSNPNYFGNVKSSKLTPVKTITSNTNYEQMECVGFNPQFGRLEAVVLIKLLDEKCGDKICEIRICC